MHFMKKRPYGKNVVMGTKDIHNKAFLKKKKTVLVFIRMISVLLAKSCSGDQKTECMAERETEDLEKKDVVFFCMFLCTSLYGAMTSSFSHLPVIPTRPLQSF
jgi:hypothetical protein